MTETKTIREFAEQLADLIEQANTADSDGVTVKSNLPHHYANGHDGVTKHLVGAMHIVAPGAYENWCSNGEWPWETDPSYRCENCIPCEACPGDCEQLYGEVKTGHAERLEEIEIAESFVHCNDIENAAKRVREAGFEQIAKELEAGEAWRKEANAIEAELEAENASLRERLENAGNPWALIGEDATIVKRSDLEAMRAELADALERREVSS
jgi:hypothetical protein